MRTASTSIVLADGRKLFREALSALLEKQADLRVVGEAEDAATAARLVKPLDVDVVLLNLTPPMNSSLDDIRRIVAARAAVKVLVLTLAPAAEIVRELFAAGVAGCLTRESAADELVAAIRAVVSHGTYLSPGLVPCVVGTHSTLVYHRRRAQALAPRKRAILCAVAMGKATKEIAAEIGVTTKTVETHRRRLMEKLNLHTIAELTKYAVLQGISPLEINPDAPRAVGGHRVSEGDF